MRIGRWKKIGDKYYHQEWENRRKNLLVKVVDFETGTGIKGWTTYYGLYGNVSSTDFKADEREKAIAFAQRYMKAHPY
jgi:hypothetical protein